MPLEYVARLVVAFAAFLISTALTFGQTVTVTRNVNLRLDSSTDQAPIRLLTPATALELLRPDAEDGYVNVRTAEGQEGWVWENNVRIEAALAAPLAGVVPTAAATAAIAPDISEDWEKPNPNKSSFTGPSGPCGWAGVGDERDSNQRKNRTDIPISYHDVSLPAIRELPYPVGPKNRSKWSPALLAEIEKFEGTAVRVKGFLVAVKPQTGSAEGTNCRFTKAAETDWHMALVENAGEGERLSVVVETTPRIRRKHPKWTKARLAPWTDTNQPVRISGWLFFDTEHRNHLDKYRKTLWEVHPITKIEVLRGNKWVELDSIQN